MIRVPSGVEVGRSHERTCIPYSTPDQRGPTSPLRVRAQAGRGEPSVWLGSLLRDFEPSLPARVMLSEGAVELAQVQARDAESGGPGRPHTRHCHHYSRGEMCPCRPLSPRRPNIPEPQVESHAPAGSDAYRARPPCGPPRPGDRSESCAPLRQRPDCRSGPRHTPAAPCRPVSPLDD